MKILVHGRIPKSHIFHGTCRICNAVIEAIENELDVDGCANGRSVPGNKLIDTRTAQAKCPVCLTMVMFKPAYDVWADVELQSQGAMQTTEPFTANAKR